MQPIIFALIAFVGWGSGDIFGGIVSRKIKGYSSSLWLYLFCFLLSSLMVPFFLSKLDSISPQIWLLMIPLNLMEPIPMVALYEGIRVGNASLVGTIGAAFAALTVILSVIFLNDRLSFFQIVSIIIIFVGLILSSTELKSLSLKKIFADKGVPYGLVAMVLWGIYWTFIRIPVRKMGWFWPTYLGILGIPVILVYMRYRKIKVEKLPSKKIAFFSFLSALLLQGATFSYNFAIMTGKTAIVAPIAGSYPVLYVILSRFVFKDRLTKQQLLGILVTLLGIAALSLSSA